MFTKRPGLLKKARPADLSRKGSSPEKTLLRCSPSGGVSLY